MTNANSPRTTRGIGAKDWLVVALVAAVVIGLGVYLLVRPGGGEAATGAAPPPEPTASATAPEQPETSSPSSPPVTPSSGAETTANSTPEGDDDVAASAVQPPGATTAEKAGPIGPIGDLARRIEGDPLALGAVDAPVVMVEFADYRCPFCAKFSRDLEPQIVERYVDAGIVRLEWRDLPIFGPESEQAAIAGRAAARQDRFWEFNAAVYANAPADAHPEFTTDILLGFAADAGVPDLEKFRADLDDPALAAAVAEDIDQGSTLGVPSTPAFVINGYPLLGAQPIDEFFRVIDVVRSLQ